jgi:hypothetical protein
MRVQEMMAVPPPPPQGAPGQAGGLTRRQVLKAGLAGSALLAMGPVPSLRPTQGGLAPFAADRRSRLFGDGLFVIHADLHNHSHLSDGDGDPFAAYASMRRHGLDAACLTDHSTLSWGPMGPVTEAACHLIDDGTPHGQAKECRSVVSIDEQRWQLTKQLARQHDAPGSFAALHGFEWSSPFLGHVNVWESQRWIDPLHTAGIDSSGLGEHFRDGAGALHGIIEDALGHIQELQDATDGLATLLDGLGRAHPAHTGMLPFYKWLSAPPGSPVFGGGRDGLACFNHPGRESGRFSYFRYHPAVADQFVAMEILNRQEDYLFKEFAKGQPSPLIECLNAGWRVGLIGVTDEHGTDWGAHPDKGRAGLWVRELTRAGVREALAARRTFATFTPGLRVDAAARPRPGRGQPPPGQTGPGGGWRRMGSVLEHERGAVQVAVDLDGGPEWVGRPVAVQVLRPADHVPAVVHVEEVVIPAPDAPLISFTVPLDRADGDWVVLRIADPTAPNRHGIDAEHPGNAAVVAYTSPFWLGAQRSSSGLSGLSLLR